MNIHEYQAKAILSEYGINIPKSKMVTNAQDAKSAAQELGGKAVVKAQVHAGGRGKAGGVKIGHTPTEVATIAESLIGTNLVTHQTGTDGAPINCVLVEEATSIKQEMYFSIVIDGATKSAIAIASLSGGMDIEEVAATEPEKILRVSIDPGVGFSSFQGRSLGYQLGLSDANIKAFSKIAANCYKVFIDNDCSLIELNPLAITGDDTLTALDAKIEIEEDSLFRHQSLESLRDTSQEDSQEKKSREIGLSYVKLEGDVGCMVNGAGLAMATMDIVKTAGAQPANFLDVGGGASQEKIAAAFTLLLEDSQVKKILVNIFGGILRCDIAAKGIVDACKNHKSDIPIVVRLLGTNADEGKSILQGSGLNIRLAETLIEAANLITTSN